jgi:CubicO group peptidase (beta-lactamase class C family)
MSFRSGTLVTLALLVVQTSCNQVPRAEPEPAVIAGSLGADLDRYLEGMVPLGFSGSFLVAQRGEVLLHGGYGLADRENGTPMTGETVFDILSITKQFTAAAILKLEEQGRLHTSDPIDRFFDDVPSDKQGITLHHLLTHSSGLIRDGGFDYEVMPRDALVRLVLDAEPAWAPGTRYRYSNAGYSLLGAIIEIASGQPYEQYLHEHLFRPAGMLKTGYRIPTWPPADLAVGYREGRRWGTPLDQRWAPDGPWWNLRANGGILSTLGDLYLWHQALESDLVLSAASRAKLFEPHIPEGPGSASHYGYGWSISETPRGTRLVSHDGGNPYFFATFLRYVDEDVVILLATNQLDHQVISAVRQGVIDAVFSGRSPVVPPTPQRTLSSTAAGRYAGTYALPSGARFVVSLKEGLPTVDAVGQEAVDLLMGYSEEEAAAANRRSELAGSVIAGFVAGNLEPLREASANFEERREVLERIWRVREENGGAFRTHEVLGTVPGWREEVPVLVTFVRLDFERGSELFRLHWDEAGVFGFSVGGSLSHLAPTLLIPQAEHSFVGYNLSIQRPVPVRFVAGSNGPASDLAIQTARGEMVVPREKP